MGVNESVQLNEKYFGFRIYNLIPNGPLSKSGVNIIDDFIIPPEDMYIKKLPFSDWIKEKADQTIPLTIYSLSKRAKKEIQVKVNPLGSKEGLLGGSVRYENYTTAPKNVLHVLKVNNNSFAKDKLDLQEKEDYLMALRPIQGDIITLNRANSNPLELFGAMIKQNIGKECDFFIFNRKRGGRAVTAQIDNNQFFEMGCDVAFGKLHEYPYEQRNSEESQKLKEESGEIENI